MVKEKLLFHVSGVNSTFHGAGGSFQDYIQHMQNIIALGRPELNPENFAKIMGANSPFELRPDHPNKKGILLIHGLYDSPFCMRDIAIYWARRGFLVRTVLLPGHGTVPGDLLEIKYAEWVKAVTFAVQSFQGEVDELYLAGYSLGGALAISAATKSNQIRGLLLFAPALRPKRLMGYFIDVHKKFFNWSYNYGQWYQHRPSESYARYTSCTYNAAIQVTNLMRETRRRLRKPLLSHLPLFVALSEDDESINPYSVLAFFATNYNTKSRLLLYTNNQSFMKDDQRILVKSSAYPKLKIIDLSHTAIHHSPNNEHYGVQGDFHDFAHYNPNLVIHPEQVYFGAITAQNLRTHIIERLSYNPDYDNMMQMTMDFFARCG